jgi:hypothetical protein
MQSIITLLTSGEVGTWISAVTGIVTACTAVTAITPSKSDDVAINAILRVLNMLSGNFGKNINKDDK